MGPSVTVALVQMAVRDAQVEANRDRARAAVARAASRGARLVMLPELWTTGMDLTAATALAEPIPQGETVRQMRAWAQTYGLWLVGSLLERDADGRRYNTAIAVGPQGQVLPPYRKIHLFSGMHEDQALSPGCAPRLWELPWGRVGVLVCYDVRFPELARAYALAGAQGLLLMAAWPMARRAHWDVLVQARAVENVLFVAAVNRVGPGRYGPFGGGSMVVDPWGHVQQHGGTREGIVYATLDFGQTAQRRAGFPVLDDRREECYTLTPEA